MAKTIAFTATTPYSPPISDQEAALASADAIVHLARLGQRDIKSALTKYGIALQPGDTLAFFDPWCIALSTRTLIRLLHGYVAQGIAIKFIEPPFELHPSGPDSSVRNFLTMLDRHWRFMHAASGTLGRYVRTMWTVTLNGGPIIAREAVQKAA